MPLLTDKMFGSRNRQSLLQVVLRRVSSLSDSNRINGPLSEASPPLDLEAPRLCLQQRPRLLASTLLEMAGLPLRIWQLLLDLSLSQVIIASSTLLSA